MKSYNMKEASELLGVSYRTIRYYKDIFTAEVSQDGRDVQLSEKFIELVRINRKQKTNRVTDKKTKAEYRAELDALKEKYQKAIQEQKTIYEKKLGQFSELDIDFDKERIEVFTHEQYTQFENALIDYKYQKRYIQEKEERFKVELASKDDLVEHYKNQSKYQKEQSDRILTQMEKLIEAIRRRDTIEAVEKQVISKRVDLE
jgi:DNA-binding transcriptional MerR regulator